LEATFLELRKNSGVLLPEFQKRFLYDLTKSQKFPLYLKEGLVEQKGDRLWLSQKGRLLADTVTASLVDL